MVRNNGQRHALPPRPPPSRGSDSYRPPPPSFPPPGQPPPPPGLPGFDMVDMRGTSRQTHPPQGDFTFRVDMPSAIQEARDARGYDAYRPNEGRRARDQDGYFRTRLGGDRDRNRDRRKAPSQQRRWNPQPHASDRKLLKTRHDRTEQDFAQEGEGAATYLSFDDLSDSEEAEMDISDSEAGNSDTAHREEANAATQHSDNDRDGPAPKRARLAQPSKDLKVTAEQNSAPRWSNPDPYTVIPPPDESRRRRDMVQLIRKARVQGALGSKGAVKEESDFISFEDEPAANFKSSLSSPAGPAEVNNVAGSFGNNQKDHGQSSLNTGLGHFFQPANSLPYPPHLASANVDRNAFQPPSVNVPPSPTDNFGSRKRTYEDEIKSLPPLSPAKVSKKKNMTPDGSLTVEWRTYEGMTMENKCPWLQNHNDCPAPIILARETADLYQYMRPAPHEHEVRQDIIRRLEQFLSRRYPGSELKSFGSFQNGLYLPTGDMDLVLLSKGMVQGNGRFFPKGQCYSVGRALEQSQIAHAQTLQVVAKAKVPLTKFVDSKTGLNVDISYDKLDGVDAIQTFMGWKKEYPVMEPLVMIIKHFLAMRGLNEPVNGGIGGFSVICLVVSMLQNDPSVQAREPSQLGELLMKFFRLYGMEFNFRDVAIQTNPPGLVNKRDLNLPYRNPDRISIIDPNNAENDISGGSSNTPNIVKAFRCAYESITARLEEVEQANVQRGSTPSEPISILSCIFEGDYQRWKDRRARLRLIYDQQQNLYSSVARRPAPNSSVAQGGGPGSGNSVPRQKSSANGNNQSGPNQNDRQSRHSQSNRNGGPESQGPWDNRGSGRGGGSAQNRSFGRQRRRREGG